MDHRKIFEGRNLAIHYWNTEARVIDSELARLEAHLKDLGDLRITPVKGIDYPEVDASDLLIVAAQTVPPEDFPRWLDAFAKRMKGAGHIWTPALIMARVPFESLAETLPGAVQENWYFDIVEPEHLDSLPIRVANLLRIHDHLRELHRYEATLARLEAEVRDLGSRLARLSPGSEEEG